jgi:hypothetical protein
VCGVDEIKKRGERLINNKEEEGNKRQLGGILTFKI